MQRCAECGFDWSASRRDTVAAIATCPDLISPMLTTQSDNGLLRRRSAPEVWSALEYAAHTGEAIAWYRARVAAVLAEDRPQFAAFDWDARCRDAAYNARPVDGVIAELSEACASFASKLGRLAPADWTRSGIGSDGSPRTIDSLARRAAHEAVHHVLDIRRLLRSGAP